MKQVIKKLAFLLALSSLLFIAGCTGSGGGYSTTSYGVYSGYGYPAGYGYGSRYRYDDIDIDIDRHDRVENRVDRRENVRTHSASRSGMGRPAGMSRGGGGRRR